MKQEFYANEADFRKPKTKAIHSEASCSGNEMNETEG